MSTLVSRLRAVNDRIGVLPSKLGVPQYQKVVLLWEGQATVLTPQPQVLEVDPRRVGQYLANNVEISPDDLMVKGVSRAYPEQLLVEATYILNATQNAYGEWQGKRAECLNLDRSQLMTYTALVKEYRYR